jgi:hypothetical protein
VYAELGVRNRIQAVRVLWRAQAPSGEGAGEGGERRAYVRPISSQSSLNLAVQISDSL